jgi:hypothetical protein
MIAKYYHCVSMENTNLYLQPHKHKRAMEERFRVLVQIISNHPKNNLARTILAEKLQHR